MGRIHLFELEDQDWFPSSIRNYGTDFLRFLSIKTKMFKAAVPILKNALDKSGQKTIVDIASGGGGGLLWVNEELRKEIPDLKIILTDYFPNIDAFKFAETQADNISYIAEPVDAKNVPNNLKGLRTQFLSLHHFKPEDAVKILQNAVDSKAPIAIFEAQERSVPSTAAMLFSPLTVLFTTPFIRPFKPGRLLFTYLLPVVPLFVMWDGVVSSLRTYSVNEMEELVSKVKNKDSFNWEIGRIKSGPGVVLYLTGVKK